MNIKQLSTIQYGWILFIIDFVLPIPLTILMFYLWYLRTSNWIFTTYVLVLPLLFGYIIPGIGTNILRLWAFKWDFMRMGNYFVHHGFMYAPYFALSLYLTIGYVNHLSIIQIITIVISNSFLQCFLTTWHDYWAVKAGMIEIYNKPFREGKSAAEIILDYGPISYAMFGGTYALSCLMAYQQIVIRHNDTFIFVVIFLLLGLTLMGLSGIHYVIRERKLR